MSTCKGRGFIRNIGCSLFDKGTNIERPQAGGGKDVPHAPQVFLFQPYNFVIRAAVDGLNGL
ncbi:MAG: hypothetical protein KKD44_15065 [Proteobacteria bacterium]|nr:hypothetical protein [Pseudomonadota bacterium]